MPWWEWTLIIVAVLAILILAIRIWTLAVRIDRLHRRIVAAKLALGRILVKRASDSLQLAASGFLSAEDSQKLEDAAKNSLKRLDLPQMNGKPESVSDIEKFSTRPVNGLHEPAEPAYVIESELSETLRMILTPSQRESFATDPLGQQLLEELDSTCYRLTVVRSLYNQDVSQVFDLRRLWISRIFHLAGRASLPAYLDFDDAI